MNTIKTLSTLSFTIGIILAFACREPHKPTEELPAQVTFAEHIAPIMFVSCTPCHRPNGGAPFNFITYRDAKKRAKLIEIVTQNHFMPPWPADPHYSTFKEQRILSERQIALIQKWVQQGALQGDSSKTPAPPVFNDVSLLGKPDLVLKMQSAYTVKGDNKDYFTIAKIPIELPKDTFIETVEFVPGNHRVVHHMNGYLVNFDPAKKATVFGGDEVVDYEEHSNIEAFQKLKILHDDGSYPFLSPSVSNYLPGVVATRYPKEIGGYRLSRKAALMFNMHYGPQARDTTDDSYFNIFFRKTPPQRPLKEMMLGTNGISPVLPPLVIPPNTIQTHRTQYILPQDISVITINPHMHLLGKSFWAYALTVKGDTIRLIKIPHWDFRWQYFYTFPHPVKIPAGSTLFVEGVFDNTTGNPNNPFSPPQTVSERNGSMRTTDEMFQFIINYLPYKQGDEHIDLEKSTPDRF